ncbi:hypothetical protein [Aliiroseovarius sp. S1339]|uniref:hypothetical protein n=1 Tax=Aliiroseovarius sp. S1339 TaxID=2936990 RepID=UPI0020BED87B|nr:hypothetical protein [Aliiroseovarius sp. S1339]MCK8462281.1 hypothetical protein [Aliiroseovarius sp. S1339]
MEQQSKMRAILEGFETVIPYVFPAIGGLAGIIYVNLHKLDQLNPMYWVGGGIFLGWLTARGALAVLDRWR